MLSRRAVLLGAAGGTGLVALGVLASQLGPVTAAVPSDESLLTAVIGDQQDLLALARGANDDDAVEVLAAQLRALGAQPSTSTRTGDLAAARAAAADNRARDAMAAVSAPFAQLLASLSAGLDQLGLRTGDA